MPAALASRVTPIVVYRRPGVRITDLSAEAQEEAAGRYHQFLFDAQIKFSDVLSAAVVTLSGGSLVASITFIEKIIGVGPAKCVWSLFLAWGAFIAAIMCTLFGIQMGVKEVRTDLEAFHGGNPPARRFPNLISNLRLGATTAVASGFILLAFFAFKNAEKDKGVNVVTTPNQQPPAAPAQQPSPQPAPAPAPQPSPNPSPGPGGGGVRVPRHDSFDPPPPPPPPPKRSP